MGLRSGAVKEVLSRNFHVEAHHVHNIVCMTGEELITEFNKEESSFFYRHVMKLTSVNINDL